PSTPLFSSTIHLPASHLYLHPFPTRRSSDLVRRHQLSRDLSSPASQFCLRSFGRLLLPFANIGIHFFQMRRARVDLFQHFSGVGDRKSTRLNSSHVAISYAVFCLKKKTITFP